MECRVSMDHIDSLRTAENKESPILKNSGGDLHRNLYIYRDDVVKSNKRQGVLGIVMEVPGDTGSDSSFSDDSDSDESENAAANRNNNSPMTDNEDGEKSDSPSAGQVKIMWFDGSETTNNPDDVCVVDRGFMHGDIVSLVTDPTGQLGLVLDVNVTVDLLSPDGGLITNVSSRDLKHFREFTIGDYVVCGSWLGRVDDMVENVTVLFDDGSVCKVMKADPSRLKPVSKSIADDSGFPYYPGQRVRAVSSSVFKSSRWLSGLWKANRLEGTVTKVQVGSLFIYWIASASPTEGDNQDTIPAEEQSPKDVKLLSCFSHASWQLGDWCLFSGATAKGVDNFNEECLFNNDLPSNDYPCENECTREVKKDLESHYLENGFTTSSLPDEIIGGIVAHMQSSTSDDAYEASDMDEASRLKSSNASLEPQSCAGTSSCCKEVNHENWPAFLKKHRKLFFKREKKGHKRADVYEKAFVIVNITTKVDVTWQDGIRKFQLDSRLLVPINNPGEQDFFPEQYVIEKDLNENENEFSPEVKRVGVVKSINAKERIACVRWLKPVSRPEDLREFDKEEMVSVYELDSHPDYDYCYGDVVVRLSPVPILSGPDTSRLPTEQQEDEMASRQKESEMSGGSTCHNEGKAGNDGSYVDVSSLSWVGHITGLNDGDIEVTWGNGMVSKVGPQAIYVVGREGDEESLDGGSESSNGGSWETVEENELNTLGITEMESALLSTDNGVKGEEISENISVDAGLAQNGRLSSAISFVTSLASGFFSQGRKQIGPLISDKRDLHESITEEFLAPSVNGTVTMESSARQPDISDFDDVCSVCRTKDASRMINDEVDSEVSNSFSLLPGRRDSEISRTDNEDDRIGFKHFDIAMRPIDHYFWGENEQFTGGKKWVKKVQQEWNILEKNLPDEVFVRVFEDRMDLLRAVIVGACGTPYQDGLFFFDFHLPSDFPQVPPSAYYHSGGLRVNPNLYENGKVCLSLLNTWNGKGNEVWDPSSSSILQILVSIQGLVLNSKPYFNEAGYEKQIGTVEGEKNYLPYNENTFLLNLKSMMYLLRNPPMHFEEFVKDHFRRRGHYILKACDAYYSRGCAIGSLTQDASPTDASNENSCSGGFKLMLEKLMPKLVLALNDVGAECFHFEY